MISAAFCACSFGGSWKWPKKKIMFTLASSLSHKKIKYAYVSGTMMLYYFWARLVNSDIFGSALWQKISKKKKKKTNLKKFSIFFILVFFYVSYCEIFLFKILSRKIIFKIYDSPWNLYILVTIVFFLSML